MFDTTNAYAHDELVPFPTWPFWLSHNATNDRNYERVVNVWRLAACCQPQPNGYDVLVASKLYDKLVRYFKAVARHEEARLNGIRSGYEYERHISEGARLDDRGDALDDGLRMYGLHICYGDVYPYLEDDKGFHPVDVIL